VRRLLVLGIVMTAVVAVLAVPAALGASGTDDTVSIATVDPAAGPSGTEVGFTLAGTDAAGTTECLTSSAYRLEFLAPDGVLAATGGDTVAAPADAQGGDASIRLVCYVPDATGRRVIHGLCGRFVVTDPGAVVPPAGAAAIPCAPTPRLALSQSVIAVERAVSEAFNPILAAPLTG
jgi:hypothetical protein